MFNLNAIKKRNMFDYMPTNDLKGMDLDKHGHEIHEHKQTWTQEILYVHEKL